MLQVERAENVIIIIIIIIIIIAAAATMTTTTTTKAHTISTHQLMYWRSTLSSCTGIAA